MNAALLLIDLQADYFAGGKMPLVGAEAAVQQAALLLNAARAAGLPVFHVQHVSVRAGATFFLPDSPGLRFHPAVAPHDGEAVVVKHFPNAFRATDLLERLTAAGVDMLIVAGMMTHMCVDTSVRAAFDHGLHVRLAQDACASRDLEFEGCAVPAAQVQAAYLAALSGAFAQTAAAASLAGELRRRA